MSVFTTSPHLPLSYFLFPISRFYPPRPVLYTLCYGHCIVPSFTSTPVLSSRPLIHITHHDHHQQSRIPCQSAKHLPIIIDHHFLPFLYLCLSTSISASFLSFCTIILVFISTIHFFFPIHHHRSSRESRTSCPCHVVLQRRTSAWVAPLPTALFPSLIFQSTLYPFISPLHCDVCNESNDQRRSHFLFLFKKVSAFVSVIISSGR